MTTKDTNSLNTKNMKIAYIAHPISGDITGNIQKILNIVREINLTKPNVVPFVPYLADLLAMDDNRPDERERGIDNDIAILGSKMVNELWVYGHRISNGMEAEIKLALELNIPVLIMDPDLIWPKWLQRTGIPGIQDRATIFEL
jgi:hypothetical protein